tara:strand:- start:278 stop:793 length:516 start_codon:yes stop_codon:yes gene_type:complete
VARVVSILLLLLLGSCTTDIESDLEPDYGAVYFQLGCYWPDPSDPSSLIQPAVWRCFENVESELLSGFLYLELESINSLYFCGENLTLQSGIDLYDNLITFLTNNQYDCLHITEDRNEGNSFDWAWDSNNSTLQIIWRPEEEAHKMITLVIEEAEYNQVVNSTAYFKILDE